MQPPSRDGARGRHLQQVMSHEEDVLSDNLDLLLVVDLVRVVQWSADEAMAERGDALGRTGACQPRGAHSESPWETHGTSAAGGGAGDDAREEADARDPDGLQRPLFVSCIPTAAAVASAGAPAGGVPGPGGATGPGRARVFPCSPSSHLFGGRPTSVLAAAAAGAALVVRFELHEEAARSLDFCDTAPLLIEKAPPPEKSSQLNGVAT